MPRPVLLAVDDDPEALRAVEAELRERYARDYAVVCEGSCAEAALRTLEQLATDGEDVALVLAGQWLTGHDRQRAAADGCTSSIRTRSAAC